MNTHERIIRLAAAKRSKANLEKVQELVEEQKSAVETAFDVIDQLRPIYEALGEIGTLEVRLMDAADIGLLNASAVPQIVEALRSVEKALPAEEDEQSLHGISDTVAALEAACEEYESSLEDRDYSREDRDGLWERITEALTELGHVYELN